MKKNKDRKRKVLPVWATLLVVLACIAALVGGTVLVMFLMGRLKPEVIAPGQIEFSAQTDGMAYMGGTRYDQELRSNVYLFYTSDESFYITLQPNNPSIHSTQNAVELELSGALPYDEEDVSLENGIIEIPHYVTLYKPFEVKVDLEKLKTFSEQDFATLSAPIITAKSEVTETSYIYAQIFVDLPVEDSAQSHFFDVEVTNSNFDEQTKAYEVYTNTQFSLQPVFSPKQSGMLFLNENTQKEVFYNFVKDNISFDWTTHQFTAKQASQGEPTWITAYTFKNSYYQKTILDKFSQITNQDDLNDEVIDYFNSAEGEDACVKKQILVRVQNIAVDSFTAQENKNFATTVDRYFTVTANSQNTDGTLGVRLSATVEDQVVDLKAFMGNVGIKIDKTLAKANNGGIGLKIVGGQYMKVENPNTSPQISIVDQLPENYLTDANDYYVLANTTPADANDYYWKISVSAEHAERIDLQYNLFCQTESRQWKLFETGGQVQNKNFAITASTSKAELKPEWKDQQAIAVSMNFGGEDGLTPQPKEVELANSFAALNADAVYKTVRYFLVDEQKQYVDGNGNAKTYANIFGVAATSTHHTFANGATSTFANGLFELEDGKLHIYQALSGVVKVVVATVKTDADGNVVKDLNGHYQIVQISDPKNVTIESNLSINMLSPTFAIENANLTLLAGTNIFQVYLPVGNSATKIDFEIAISDSNIITESNSGNTMTSAQKLAANWQNVLGVESLDQNGLPTQDVSLSSLVAVGNSLRGELSVVSTFDVSGGNDTSKSLSLRLWFDDGVSTQTKRISGSASGADKDGTNQTQQDVSNFLVYYPQARSVRAAFEEKDFDQDIKDQIFDANGLKTIEVEKKRQKTETGNVTQTKITWGSYEFSGEDLETKDQKIAKLNQLLEHTMIDQYGFVIDKTNSRYEVRFQEESGQNVLVLGSNGIQDFSSTQGRTAETSLRAYVWDGVTNKMVFENGLESGAFVCGPEIKFSISGEGIEYIEKTTNMLVVDEENELDFVTNYTSSGAKNNGLVQIEKYMAQGKTITLENLLKVYTSAGDENETEQYTDGLVFKLSDSFVDKLTNKQKTDIMQMLKFDTALPQQNANSIEELKGADITSVQCLLPFGIDTTIEFLVTDKDNSLFSFTLQLVCRVDVSIEYNFSTYAEKFASAGNWLKNSGLVAGVFCNDQIDLQDYMHFGKSKYSDVAYNFDDAEIAIEGNGINLGGAGAANPKTTISLDEVYQFTTISFTVYFGVDNANEYALSTKVMLYVNPNIVLQAKSAQTNLNLFDFENDCTISQHFKIYKATDYYNFYVNGQGQAPTELVENFSLQNISSEKIVYANGLDQFVFDSSFSQASKQIDLQIGVGKQQQFVLQHTQNGDTQNVGALFVVNENGDQNFGQVLHQDATTFDVVLGSGKLEKLKNLVFEANSISSVNMKSVTYLGQQHLLLAAGKVFNALNPSIKFTSSSGAVRTTTADGNGISTQLLASTFVSTTGNGFVATKTVELENDKTLKISVSVPVIVSELGTTLVSYTTTFNEGGEDIVYNFDTRAFEDLVTGGTNFDVLLNKNIYQQIAAGQNNVQIVSTDPTVAENFFGFAIGSEDLQYSLEVEKSAQGYADGLVEIVPAAEGAQANYNQTQININNLAEGQDAFAVLRMTLYKSGKTYSYHYRLRISSNFEIGSVCYPYAADAEYLDQTSPYFDETTQTYSIDLNETFDSSNGKAENTGKNRFPAAPMVSGHAMEGTTFAYKISKAEKAGAQANLSEVLDMQASKILANGFLTSGSDDGKGVSQFVAKLKNPQEQVSLYIEKIFYKNLGGGTYQPLVGTNVTYVVKFNQGKTYNSSVIQTTAGQANSLGAQNGHVKATLVAGSQQSTFTINIQEVSGISSTTVTDYHIFLCKGQAGATNALQNFDSNNLGECFSVADNGTGTLTLTPVANNVLTQNSTVSFGFHTNQKVAFVLDVEIVTAYTTTTQPSVVAGQQIALGELVSVQDASGMQQNVSVENISIGQLNEVDLTSLTSIDGVGSQIAFAHLAEDVTLTFKATVNDTYTFTFTVLVQADINLAQPHSYLPGENYVAGTQETVSVAQVLENWGISAQNNALLSQNAFVFEKTSYADINVASSGAQFDHTIPNVGGTTNDTREMRLSYKVAGKTLFTVDFTYMFVILPNVETVANYPNPTNQKMLEQEYVGTTNKNVDSELPELKDILSQNGISGNKRISNGTFAFSSAAEFAEKSTTSAGAKLRVEAKTANGSIQPEIDFDWKVSISYLFNVSIVAKTTIGGVLHYDFISAQTYQSQIFQHGTQFFFILDDASQNGRVEFQVVVNQVPLAVPYKVVVIPTNTISVGTNAPNYAGQAEIIYAEDLSRCEEKTIFDTNRILQYQFRSTVANSTQYRIQFSKGDSIIVKTITMEGTDLVNLDLGRSFDGFTFKVLGGAQEVSNLSEIFAVAPKLTSRFVVKYYDGSEVASSNFTFNVKRGESGSKTSVKSFSLNKTDVDNVVEIRPVVVDSAGNEIANSTVYNIALKTSFEVQGNADDAGVFQKEEIVAGTSKSLLTDFGFGIYNTREKQLYTPQTMATSGGTLVLQMYGFGDLAIKDDASGKASLQNTALAIHERLQNTAVSSLSTAKYHTGLNPRANANLNNGLVSSNTSEAENTNANNYITISGVLNDGSTATTGQAVDYIINAGGANNDGNHVMMCLTYRVNIGDKESTDNIIEISHNILFLVLPNINISFRTNSNNTNLEPADEDNLVLGDQSCANNANNPYVIEAVANTESYNFNLFKAPTSDGVTSSNPTIVAHLNGNSTDNVAEKFKYSYSQNAQDVQENYYNQKALKLGQTGDGFSGQIEVSKSDLGIDRYYLDLENNFGYKARFYFNVLATNNPQVASITSSALIEGQTIKVGARYNQLSANVSGDNYQTYQPAEYVGWHNTNDEQVAEKPYLYQNTLKISKENLTGNVTIESVKISFRLPAAQTLVDSSGTSRTVQAGARIYRTENLTIAGQNGVEVSIFDTTNSKTWQLDLGNGNEVQLQTEKDTGNGHKLKQSMLIGAQFSVGLNITGSPVESLGTFSVIYSVASTPADGEIPQEDKQEAILQMPYSQTQNHSPQIALDGVDSDTVGVELSGIEAYALDENFKAVDKNAIKDKTSEIDTFVITNVAFKLPDNTVVPRKTTSTEQQLITSSKVHFLKSNLSTTAGVDASSVDGFVVPYLDGSCFGTNDILNDVIMQITIEKKDSGITSVMEYPVSITRKVAANASILANDGNVLDGKNPTIIKNAESGQTMFSNVKNDTLEIELQPYEHLEFVISNDSISDANNAALTRVVVENNFGYALTRYVGISSNMNNRHGGLSDLSNFHLAVANRTISGQNAELSEAKIYYSGKVLSQDGVSSGITLQEASSQEILFHNGLNIENVAELSSRTKQISLHLLAKARESGQVYQYAVPVTINPLYSSAKGSTDVVSASEYYKISEGATGKGQYIVPLESWAANIDLTPSIEGAQIETKISKAGAYKFRYEINTTPQGAGSAIIDENGNIITTDDFDVDYHRLYVNVYMKVSGMDGSFGSENTELLLNEKPLEIALAKKNTNTTVQTGGDEKIVSVNGTPIVLPSGKNLYATDDSLSSSATVLSQGIEIDNNVFATQLGSSKTLAEWFDSLENLQSLANKHYHLLVDEVGTFNNAGTSKTYYNFNNYDQFTFGSVGKHKITVVVTGRVISNGEIESEVTPKSFKATVLVYEDNMVHETFFGALSTDQEAGESGNLTLPGGQGSSATTYDWYLQTTGGILKQQANSKYNVDQNEKLGLQAKTFFRLPANAQESTNPTIVNATIFVCDEVETKEVDVSTNQMYSLANLAPAASPTSTFVWYRLKNFENGVANGGIDNAVTREDLSHYANNAKPKFTYVLVIYDALNNVEQCILYNITFNVGAI